MNKNQLILAAIAKLTRDLDNNINAAKSAHDASIDDQSIAETQYDTLAIEAAYLAEGQSRRVQAITAEILQLEHLQLNNFNEETPIRNGALIQLSQDIEKDRWFFMVPAAGGFTTKIDNNSITFITPQSPMGQALLGKLPDDEIALSIGSKQINCYVSSIC